MQSDEKNEQAEDLVQQRKVRRYRIQLMRLQRTGRVVGCGTCLWRSDENFDRAQAYGQRSIEQEIHATRALLAVRANERRVDEKDPNYVPLTEAQIDEIWSNSFQIVESIQER